MYYELTKLKIMLNKYTDNELLKILYDNPEELSKIFEIIYERYSAMLLTFY